MMVISMVVVVVVVTKMGFVIEGCVRYKMMTMMMVRRRRRRMLKVGVVGRRVLCSTFVLTNL
jgi:hypothetical protein